MNREQTTFLVADNGSFLPLAITLANHGCRVLYHRLDWQKGFPSLNECIVGDGFKPLFECVSDLFDVISGVDTFVFPDIQHAGLQKHLRSIGKNVWGSADGMSLETDRMFFMGMLDKLGLDVPEWEPICGLTNLRAYLTDKEEIYIKVSKFRGSFETCCFRSMDIDCGLLDSWAVRFGGMKEHITFLVFPKIETKLEIGADTYCVDGQWPSFMLHGLENKDSSYFAAVTEREKMPEELLPIMESFSPYLKEVKFRSFWSMEVRIAENGNFFLDATCRCGLPSTASQLVALDNLPEILYYGAQGELVEPEYNTKFTAEALVKKTHVEEKEWYTIKIPDELKENLILTSCCMIDGQPWFPPEQQPIENEIGWLVTKGETPIECAKAMNSAADALPDGYDASTEALAEVFREMQHEEEQSIQFTALPLPEPELVLEPSNPK